MAPSVDPLQGLNSVPQPTPRTTLSDSQDLLSAPHYSDLAAQLDLWTNISFASDEPFVPSNLNSDDADDEKKDTFDRESGGASEEVKRKRQLLGSRQLPVEQHLKTAQSSLQHQAAPLAPAPASAFDFQSLFNLAAGIPQTPLAPELQNMNLHTLLALGAYSPFQQTGLQAPPAPPIPAVPTATSTPQSGVPPTKKSRGRKTSTSAAASGNFSRATTEAYSPEATSPADDQNEEGSSTSLTPAEDKRRRNTQASARFRLKKKEREAAMDSRCRELENKVSELERECEALRRENGWLKGLVVGVTGGTQMPTMPTSAIPASKYSASSSAPASASAASTSKRSRVDDA